ncbi:MAG: nuclear transport factor 2 family protein [Egibacteraceae bacterium]
MTQQVPLEEGLSTISPGEAADRYVEGQPSVELTVDSELESLRDEFVEGFNARNLDAVLALVHEDIECPDIAGDGADVFAEELQAIWERSPGALLTRALLDGAPCAMGWLPDDAGRWCRAALVCFDVLDGLLGLMEMPDDPDSLDRAETTDPSGEDLDEWSDWSEWERGEETPRPQG